VGRSPTDSEPDRILVVDDDAPIRRILCQLLEQDGYVCNEAADAEEAMRALQQREFALVLTDMGMPGKSGLDLILQVSEAFPDTATVMVTGVDDANLAHAALDTGAYGYIIKPFEPNEILINVRNALRRRALEIENRAHRQRLEQTVMERTRELWEAIARLERTENELSASREETIHRLAIAAEFRDDDTAQHIQRMSRYCAMLWRASGFGSERADAVRVASLMHDVGKIGLPDNILLKPGKLTAEERTIMQQHCEIGNRILSGSESELLETAAVIARTHHERVDGTGYPSGLRADEIPVEGRIAAIADVFDALTSDRVYKKAYPLAQALEIMREGRGSHFDSALLDCFLDVISEALEIRRLFSG
jgi:putative two-component system response regulator